MEVHLYLQELATGYGKVWW